MRIKVGSTICLSIQLDHSVGPVTAAGWQPKRRSLMRYDGLCRIDNDRRVLDVDQVAKTAI